MRRRLAIVGLAVPLVAFVVALVYLYLFGTSEPTFEAATQELAREHTVVRLREEPPAAIVVPSGRVPSVVLVMILADDERHVWSATRELGLLDYVEREGLALIPVAGVADGDGLLELAKLASVYFGLDGVYLAGFMGQRIASLCAGDGLGSRWSGVAVVGGEDEALFDQCGEARVLWLDDSENRAERMVQWMLEGE